MGRRLLGVVRGSLAPRHVCIFPQYGGVVSRASRHGGRRGAGPAPGGPVSNYLEVKLSGIPQLNDLNILTSSYRPRPPGPARRGLIPSPHASRRLLLAGARAGPPVRPGRPAVLLVQHPSARRPPPGRGPD